eukprot:3314005-Alexandrium_andersonii.AAC.1
MSAQEPRRGRWRIVAAPFANSRTGAPLRAIAQILPTPEQPRRDDRPFASTRAHIRTRAYFR